MPEIANEKYMRQAKDWYRTTETTEREKKRTELKRDLMENGEKIALKLKWHSKWNGERNESETTDSWKCLAIARNTDSQLCSVGVLCSYLCRFFFSSKSVNECKQQQKYKFSIYDGSFERCLFRCRFIHFEMFFFSFRTKIFYQFVLIHLYSFQVIYFLNARLNPVIDTELNETNTETAAKMWRALSVTARNGNEHWRRKKYKRRRHKHGMAWHGCVCTIENGSWMKKSQNVIRVHRWLVELGQTNRLSVA